MYNSAAVFDKGFEPFQDESIMKSILAQYERVLVESLITTFGLDFIVKDQYGGDVDTIHNVGKIGVDSQMIYKNRNNKIQYDNRGIYDSSKYHSSRKGSNYQKIKHNAKEKNRLNNNAPIEDAYTGGDIYFLGRSKGANPKLNAELDHVVSAKSIHDSRIRVLAEIDGTELANMDVNLKFTNKSLNASMKHLEIPDYIAKHPELDEKTKQNMMRYYNNAVKEIEDRCAEKYYRSDKFKKDLVYASTNLAFKMGVRQALGFVFSEIWFAVKYEFQKLNNEKFEVKSFLYAIGNGIKNGYENSKNKYPEIFSKFINGAVAGALSSLTTTLCNVFFTTAKHTVKIIRNTYASLVEAVKVLFINPDNYLFGERMRAVVKILSTGASAVVGILVSEAISKTPIGNLGTAGDIIKDFCGVFVTGIMSCTLLFYIDRSETFNKLVGNLDKIHTIDSDINYFKNWALYFEEYAAKLMDIDIDKFKTETSIFTGIAQKLDSLKDDIELNKTLRDTYIACGIQLPWKDYADFSSFMEDKSAHLVFG